MAPDVDTHLILFSNLAVLELTLEPLPTKSEWAIAPTLRGPRSRFDRFDRRLLDVQHLTTKKIHMLHLKISL